MSKKGENLMNTKKASAKLPIIVATTFVFAIVAILLWQASADAQSKKEFKGATLENNQLVPKAGHTLRQASDRLIEVIKEETTTTGSGPTARRVTKPVKVNGINVSCVCGGTTSTTNCSTLVTSGGASCKAKNNGCSKCEMIATEN
jgi:hypothetical protein